MPPTESDNRVARGIAERIGAAGQGAVRRVHLFGSRARGAARRDSDFDLLVVVETPDGTAPWGPREAEQERRRLVAALGDLPVRIDLAVRSTDRYEEAKGVIGGIEQLSETEGVIMYQRPLSRPPLPARTRDEVRLAFTGTWISHAWMALEQAARLWPGDGTVPVRMEIGDQVRKAARRSLTALLVHRGIASFKHEGVVRMAERVDADDAAIGATVRPLVGTGAVDIRAADALVRAATDWLERDPAMARFLEPLCERRARPADYAPETPLASAGAAPSPVPERPGGRRWRSRDAGDEAQA